MLRLGARARAVCSCPGARSWSELTLALAPVLASRCCWPRAPGAAAFSGPLPVPGPAARARAMMMTRQGRGPSFTLYAPPSRAASRLLGRAQAPAVDRACGPEAHSPPPPGSTPRALIGRNPEQGKLLPSARGPQPTDQRKGACCLEWEVEASRQCSRADFIAIQPGT